MLSLTLAASAWAEDAPNSKAAPKPSLQASAQTLYKGIIGNVLDTLPMDPLERVDLQRTSAVVSNTTSGRSLSALVGLSNPLLMLGGLVWGLWAASNIEPVAADAKVASTLAHANARPETGESLPVLADNSPAEKNPAVPNSAAGPVIPAPRSPVIRLWLPQPPDNSIRLGALK